MGLSPVIQDLHYPILFDPQLPKDDIVYTAGGVGPRVGFIMSVKAPKTRHGSEAQNLGDPEGHDQSKPDLSESKKLSESKAVL